MRVTLFTDYALRVMIYAALQTQRFTIAEVAARYGISRSHLTKVVQQLAHLGYLDAKRGKSGGLQLGRPAADINLGELVRAIESDFALVSCFDGGEGCVIGGVCELRQIFDRALADFMAQLDRYSIADLVPGHRHKDLLKVLQLPT